MLEFSPEALQDIQGIILSGYGHLNYAVYMFLQFDDAAKSKDWLQRLIPQVVSAKRWQVRADGRKDKPDRVLHIAFSYRGVRALDLSQEALDSFSPEFIEGMEASAKLLGDVGSSSPEEWEMGGPNNRSIHAVLILHAETKDAATEFQDVQRRAIERTGGAVIEIGSQCGSRPAETQKNPFGFRDGISEPTVQGTPGNPTPSDTVIAAGEFVLGYFNGYKLYPPSPSVLASNDPQRILPSFPNGRLPRCRDFGRNGSYIVYRKLETDIAQFWRYLQDNTAGTNADETQQEMIYLASKCIGRWPSGAPLVLSPQHDQPELWKQNDFTFESDPQGHACPYGSHIRRANPRASFKYNSPESSFITSNQHRIIRRAVYYGKPLFDLTKLDQGVVPLDLEDDGEERGLHFFSINADIKNQFEFVQEMWCNNAQFNGLFNNKDPIIGDNDGTSTMTIERETFRRRLLGLPRFVHTKGGGYFFLPSVSALRYLSS